MKKLQNECQQYLLDNPELFELQASNGQRLKIDYSSNTVEGNVQSKKKKKEGLDAF